MAPSAWVDEWKIETVRGYLRDRFQGSTIDQYPRGDRGAHLFVVILRKEVAHQVLITAKFFDRMRDPMTLGEALAAAEVGERMRQKGDITIELH